jgi:hypothetical protein
LYKVRRSVEDAGKEQRKWLDVLGVFIAFGGPQGHWDSLMVASTSVLLLRDTASLVPL